MNFRDPVLERARFLLLQLAEGDQDLLDREIRAELNTHGEVHLSCMTERMTTLWEQRHGRKLELPQSDRAIRPRVFDPANPLLFIQPAKHGGLSIAC